MVECELHQPVLFYTQRQRFNRYMVECESNVETSSLRVKRVLIDTWWNVNLRKRRHNKHRKFVLIDTWWNVNVFTKVSVTAPL